MRIGLLFSDKLPFSPVFYTLLSLITAGSGILCAFYNAHATAIVLFCMAASCDVIDGAVARAQNKASNLGAFIDGVTDRFVDFALLFSYFFCNIKTIGLPVEQWICIASFVVILPSFNVAYANHRGAVDDDDETLIWRLMNRAEMFVLMLAILIMSLFNSNTAGYLLLLLVALSSITILQTIFTTIYYAQKRATK